MIAHNSLNLNFGKESASELDRLASAEFAIRFETRIAARARDIFHFFTAGGKMKSWLAPVVTADPQRGGLFRLSDLNGSWIEGRYLEIVSRQRVVFTWGGIHGLGVGESIVEFSLLPDACATIVRLQHSHIPEPAFDMHRLGWREWGLPRLKAAAEGHRLKGTFLDCIAEAREQFAYKGTSDNSRLQPVHLDQAALQHNDPVVRDLERTCTVCGEKRRCERELAHPDARAWQS